MPRVRKPRSKLPSEVPLDDGTRYGTELWREVRGVRFCHWDRWLLRLALEESEGLRSIAREFRRRATSARRIDGNAEAMLAQLEDLEGRMAALRLTPVALLDDVERASTWLRDKAFRRIWHSTSMRHTAAMERTPRKLLEARALWGNWTAFSVSPAPYFALLRAVVGDGWYDHGATEVLVLRLDVESARLLATAETDERRFAIRRAALTTIIGAMDQVDDSLAELAEHFHEHERAYLDLLPSQIERPGVLCDLLELVVWEGYGLFSKVNAFLSSLSEPQADLALRDLARIIAELRAKGLDYQLKRAMTLRRAVVASVRDEDEAVRESE